MDTKTVVLMPTYNEIENIDRMVSQVRAQDVSILIIDDRSPDGTGERADALAAEDSGVHVLHRQGKQGLGPAYIAGFEWALGAGFDACVEMDADGSHRPDELPRLLTALQNADVVQGSRWVSGGKVVDWPWYRKVISQGGSWYSRTLLGLPVRDVTGGYRAYRRSALERIGFASVSSAGYCFQIDMLRRAHDAGMRIVEVPITFADRALGASKMSGRIVVEAMWRTTVWGLQRWTGRAASARTAE